MIKIEYEDKMSISFTDEPETEEVIINNKRFHFEVDYDVSDIWSIHLTECGDPVKTEMLEAYDFYLTE